MIAWSRAFADVTKQVGNQHEHDLVTLYVQLRAMKPDLYVELGRGQGSSTLAAAMAIAANRKGRLVSFDLHEVTGHDLLVRLAEQSGIDIDTRVQDIRELRECDWSTLCKGSETITVLVDAHEGTGHPVTEVLLPFLRNRSSTRWFAMFHDVLKVGDEFLYNALFDSYAKDYPYASPYPEYKAIFPVLRGANIRHFSELGTALREEMKLLGVTVSMPADRANVHKWRVGTDLDEISRRYSTMVASSMLCASSHL